MPVFVLWPADGGPTRAHSRARRLLDSAAALVVVAAVLSGGAALVDDLGQAFRDAGDSVFTPLDRKQMAAVRDATRNGATLLLTADPSGKWSSYVWQRALYPDRRVIAVRDEATKARLAPLMRAYRFDAAIAIGDPPPDPGFRSHRDLGPIPGAAGSVWFGELAP